MFRLNLKIAFRNLYKNKVYTLINIGGLALGLTAFVLLLLYINHEESYDSWSPELQDVYQVREFHDYDSPDAKQHWQTNSETRNAMIFENLPQVRNTTKIEKEWGDENYAIKTGARPVQMIKGIRDADSSFFKVMPYLFIQGDKETALSKPNTIVLKKEMAVKLFGTENALGKSLKIVRWEGDTSTDYIVSGVVKEPISPQSLTFTAIIHTGRYDKYPDNPAMQNFAEIYVRLVDQVDTASINKSVQDAYLKKFKRSLTRISYADYLKAGNLAGLKIIPLKAAHSQPPFTTSWFEKIKPIILISVFLLLVSIINFINLTTAQSVRRAKEVGVRKVLGSNKNQLITQFLFEAALQSFMALFVCIILVELTLPAFNHYFNVSLSFWHNVKLFQVIIQLTGIFVLITLMAGFYPAWLLSSYRVASVLKGNYASSLKGIALRNALVIFQFVISVTFMIAIGVMHLQARYMDNKDLGFDKNNLININTNYNDLLAQRIKRIPGVKYVATTTQIMGNAFNFPQEIIYKGEKLSINIVTVSMEALPALGVQILEGRIFSPKHKLDTVNTVVVNEGAAKLIDKHVVGKIFNIYEDAFQIIGVIKDYHNEDFDKEVLPTIYKVTTLGGTTQTNNLLVRFDADNQQGVIKKIETEWKKLYPEYNMQYKYVSDSFNQVLENDKRFMNMIVIFSGISISLSLLGLFALATFVANRRTKEIAIRKILGASDLQIISLLNRSFLMLILAANLISWPIAYILTSKWLDGFAYRIDMPVIPFVAATISSVVIALFTVSLQARKAAVRNPVDSLKYE